MGAMEKLSEKELSLLEKNTLFAGLSKEEERQALEILKARREDFEKGEMIHRAGEDMNVFGLVLFGRAEACMDDFEGNRIIMAEVMPGTTFGEALCFLKIHDSPVYVFAPEDTRLLWLSPEELFRKAPEDFRLELQRRFSALLAERTLSMNSRIQVLSKLRLRDKLITCFSQFSRAAGSDTFLIPMSREDFARYIGADRSALSRELSRMKKEGIIDYYRNTVRILK